MSALNFFTFNSKLTINGCSFLRVNFPSHSKFVFIETMQKTFVTDISVNNENASFTCFYRLPSLPLTNINNNQPTSSIFFGDIREKCSKFLCSN